MLLCFVAAALFVGCQKDSENLPIAQERSVTVELSISTEEVSRATPTEMESAINSLRIYAFYNGKKAGYTYREATTAGAPLYMDLQLPESGVHNVDFYLIAKINKTHTVSYIKSMINLILLVLTRQNQ